MAGFKPVKTGYDPRGDSSEGNGEWLTLKNGEVVECAILVEAGDIISVDQCAIWLDDGKSPVWVYTGPEDPAHALGVEKRYRAYLPVLVDGEPKVWSMGKQSHGAVLDIADAGASLKGMMVRIKRTGEKLRTKYSIVPMGKRKDVSDVEEVDVISMLGPTDTSDVEAMLAKRFEYDSYAEFVKGYKPAKGKGKGGSGKSDDIESLDLS